MSNSPRRGSGRPSWKISWAHVAVQILSASVLAWIFVGAIVLMAVGLGHRSGGSALALALLSVIVLALVGGMTGVTGTPIPLTREVVGALLRPLGALSRGSDVLLRPERTGGPEDGEDEGEPNGLTPLGVALAVIVELGAVLAIVNPR